jgi:uncharacterized protein YjgD (DUF1641 family)
MAEPIQYTPKPPKVDSDAHEALEHLLETAHQHGVLRFANDLIASNGQWAQVLADGLNKEGSRKAVQNLAMLLMLLSRIEPKQLYKLLFAARDSLEYVARYRPGTDAGAPGVKGAYQMLHDEALWRSIAPLLDALKVFGNGLERDVQTPISAFSGKQTRQS